MRIELTHFVAGVDPADALRWWSDFQDGHADHAFVPGARRRILARDGDATTMEERVRPLGIPLFRETTTARIEPHAVRFEGTNTFSRFQGAYFFEPISGGTRIRLGADIQMRPRLRPAATLARPLVKAILRRDLAGHAREMAADLGRGTV